MCHLLQLLNEVLLAETYRQRLLEGGSTINVAIRKNPVQHQSFVQALVTNKALMTSQVSSLSTLSDDRSSG